MKWVGAILLIGATTISGFYLSLKYTERPKEIRLLIHALQMIEAEMIYSQLPLYQLFYSVSEKTHQPLRAFFYTLANELKGKINNFYDLWSREVNNLVNRCSLNQSEAHILNQFGKSLGQYNITEQQKQIRLTIAYLNRELDEAIDEREKYEKLTKSIGFLIGLFIVIVFI